MDSQHKSKTLVIGVGSSLHCDESISLIISKRLERLIHMTPKSFQHQSITITECTGDASSLMDVWQGYDNVYIIYTVHEQTKPGQIHYSHANEEHLALNLFKHSSYAQGILLAVESARALGKLPPNVFIYGIAGENFNFGQNISKSVQIGALQVFEHIYSEILRLPAAAKISHKPTTSNHGEYLTLH